MHIVIGFLTTLATLLYVLDRLGIDLGWFNPWAWRRRRAWIKQSTGNPAFCLDKPIDAVALIATAAAKIDGDLSLEEKNTLKSIFQSTFNLSEQSAAHLLGSSVYLLGSGEAVFQAPDKVLKRSLENFSDAQRQSSADLLSRVINLGDGPSALQKEFMQKVEPLLTPNTPKGTW